MSTNVTRVLGAIAAVMGSLALVLGCAFAGPGCSRPKASAVLAAPGDAAATATGARADNDTHLNQRLEFVDESFAELYPVFLVRRSMPIGDKAHLWATRYLGRYVRWTGIIRSFTSSGVTLKHKPSTITFDVSLWLESDQLTALRRDYHKGDSLSYLARLDSYDDIFRTLYLGHGLIADLASPSASKTAPDGGSSP